MTKENLALVLNEREYGSELTSKEEEQIKAAGLVVVFGASDDMMELRGAIHDELDCYTGGEFLFDENGTVLPDIEPHEQEILEKHFVQDIVKHRRAKAEKITAVWNGGSGYSWTYETTIPHATFEIMDDNEKYCRGIVFELGDLKQ